MEQTDWVIPEAEELQDNRTYLVYLDVWERHITYVEDDSIREVALKGPDTATRARVVWQVKTKEQEGNRCPSHDGWEDLVAEWQPRNRGHLKARARPLDEADLTDPCIMSPRDRYRGAENQLYRVEIHTGGSADEATFKWSRDNGSVVFPIRKLATDSEADKTILTLEHLGRGSGFGLEAGDWVEIVDDAYVLEGRAEPLLKVVHVDSVDLQVTLDQTPESQVGQDPGNHPLLRRWDHQAGEPTEEPQLTGNGALQVSEGEWLNLEDGVQIWFEPVGRGDQEHLYRTGDYWLIAARRETRNVQWPTEREDGEEVLRAMGPHGVEHHYAPLATISLDGDGLLDEVVSCRHTFEPMAQP
jgi:hypothetical protein